MKISREKYLNITGLLSILLSLATAAAFWPEDSDAHGDRAIVIFVYGPVFVLWMLVIWWGFKRLGKFFYGADENKK